MSYLFKKLFSVVGSVGKLNDVIFCRQSAKEAGKSVIFFGGDLQDFEERMEVHCQFFIQWNLDKTAKLLADHFPEHNIYVVKSSKMYLNKFSCFTNFVESDEVGSPTYSNDAKAFEHLKNLLLNCQNELRKDEAIEWNQTQQFENKSLTIIGFSKGCVVLNQLIHEMHHNREKSETKDLVEKIQAMYWLDAGHNGDSEVWVQNQDILKSLSQSGIEINVHVTPYEMEDSRRPWIKDQKDVFVSTLETFGKNVNYKYHFFGEMPRIERHFQILKMFRSES